jgi:hypothetical protein
MQPDESKFSKQHICLFFESPNQYWHHLPLPHLQDSSPVSISYQPFIKVYKHANTNGYLVTVINYGKKTKKKK